MRRSPVPSAFLIVSLMAAAPLFAHDSHRSVSVENDGNGSITDCSQLRVSFDDQRVQVVSEEVTAVSGLRALTLDARSSGGIRVVGWDQNRYAVTACKAVPSGLDASAIRINLNGNEVSADGPDSDYYVYYLVRAPRSATIDLRATNGPLSIEGTGGSITARTKNGPISLRDVDGTVDADAVNGPISFSGNRGTVKLHAQNGPISVKLAGSAWEGGSFDAQTSNGPLTLRLPRNYASGVVVESDGHGPVSCKADACRAAYDAAFDRNRSRDDDYERPRRLEFGTASGSAALHLSTSNGPISIRDTDVE